MQKWKIILLPRLQIDSIVACFLLKYFGSEKFPGIENAEYDFWVDVPKDKTADDLEKEGYILVDMGGGKFDHHKSLGGSQEKCTSEIVAEYLGISNSKAIKKLLAFARRDDLEGKGVISEDPIDRAFGLPGLMNNLNRMLPDDQEAVLRTVMPLLLAHYLEEKKRTEDFPAEYEAKMKNGKASRHRIESVRGPITIIVIETDEIGMAGYLRTRHEINASIVIQKASTGHVNIVTQQKGNFDLSEVARLLRKGELHAKGGADVVAETELTNPGRVVGVEEWYFDTKAKTIQNGGIRPQGITPTKLTIPEIVEFLKKAAIIRL